MRYIILSPKHSTKEQVVFWRADDCGYTSSPFAAGIYTQEQIDAHPHYYNNGDGAIAIPLTDDAMANIGFKVELNWDATKQFLPISKPLKPARTGDDNIWKTAP